MSKQDLVKLTVAHVKKKFIDDTSGHDWWHMYRVWKMAEHITKSEEGVDKTVVELGALLHDIADFKFHDGDIEAGPREARKWLESIGAPPKTITHVEDIVRNVSFKGAKVKNNLSTKEGQIVHDADKLDAIGAIGIARVFSYAGFNGNVMFDPDIKPTLHSSFEQYKSMKPTAINHFYEKILLLKDRMYTKTGKEIAEHRHTVIVGFLKEFHDEWDAKN